MSNTNDGKENENRNKFSGFDDFAELDELLNRNRKKQSDSASVPVNKGNTGSPDRALSAPKDFVGNRPTVNPPGKLNMNIPEVSRSKPELPPTSNVNIRQNINIPPTSLNKSTVTDAKIRDGFQQERAEIFNRLEKDEQYRNRHSTPKKNAGDGSYRYAGKDIKSNRQKLVDVQPKPRTSRINADPGVTVRSAKKQKIDAYNEYEERDKFFLSGIMKAILYIVAVIAVSIVIAVNVLSIANDVFAFVKEDFEVTVTIPEDASLSDVADVLIENNLIKYPSIFEFYINYRRKDKEWIYVPGTYTLSSMMNYDEFIGVIRQRTSAYEEIRLTVPEGFTIDEIIELFVGSGIGTKEGFISVINDHEFDVERYKFIKLLDEAELSPNRKYRLEGYLFPDTYNFYKNSTELQVITKFLNNFNSKFTEDFYTSCDMLGMTVDEVITLASIVEREAKNPGDFPIVSSVFHNRLLNKSTFPMLESNATIQYSLDEHREDFLYMTAADLELDLPYNTYKYPGLPPSAICNPGYEAIFAAVEPDITDYFYFVSKNDGSMLYGRTYQEHLQNINIARSEQ